MKVRITLLDEMLGTKAANKDVFADFIASKCPDDDLRKQELDTAEHREEAGTSVFHRTADGKPMIWDYQVKGFLKEAADIMRQTTPKTSTVGKKTVKSPWGNAKSKVDNSVFVEPRQIALDVEQTGVCERPLRVMTMQGPRVSVARSETVPEGLSFDVEIILIPGSLITEDMLRACLDYGRFKGLGQWRNSGKGRFRWRRLNWKMLWIVWTRRLVRNRNCRGRVSGVPLPLIACTWPR